MISNKNNNRKLLKVTSYVNFVEKRIGILKTTKNMTCTYGKNAQC